VHGPAGGAGEIEDLVCLLSRDERKERIEDDDWRKKRWPVVGAEARYLYRAGPTEVERTSQLSPSRWICKLDRTLRRELRVRSGRVISSIFCFPCTTYAPLTAGFPHIVVLFVDVIDHIWTSSSYYKVGMH
jgi:hypothetical protein